MTIDLSGLITAADKFKQAKQSKISALSAACKQAIIDGFDSDALGTVHHYPAKDTDQTNLLGRVIQARINIATPDWTAKFWCSDSTGNWDIRPHTAAQMIAVGLAGAADVEAKTLRNLALAAQAMAAQDQAALDAIEWSYP
jgi:hypothetical protein